MEKIGEKKTSVGTFKYYLDYTDRPELVTKLGDKETRTEHITTYRDTKCVFITELNVKLNGEQVHHNALPFEVVETFETAKRKHELENIMLVHVDRSMETGIDYYSLSTRVSKDLWAKIAEFFDYHRADEEETWSGYALKGWLTTQFNVEKIEKILAVKKENTVDYRKEQSEKASKERAEQEKHLDEKLKTIDDAFINAEYPASYEMFDIEGEEIQHPRNPKNIYGGGEWWTITEKYIWHIKNNGMDGDDWSRNNVKTGGAGAIGRRIPHRGDVAEIIRDVEVK
jgi:DNA-binding transcriptional MerR regulator